MEDMNQTAFYEIARAIYFHAIYTKSLYIGVETAEKVADDILSRSKLVTNTMPVD